MKGASGPMSLFKQPWKWGMVQTLRITRREQPWRGAGPCPSDPPEEHAVDGQALVVRGHLALRQDRVGRLIVLQFGAGIPLDWPSTVREGEARERCDREVCARCDRCERDKVRCVKVAGGGGESKARARRERGARE